MRARRWKEGKGGSVEVQCDDEERGTNNQREIQCPRQGGSAHDRSLCSRFIFTLLFLAVLQFNNGVPLNNMKVEEMG